MEDSREELEVGRTKIHYIHMWSSQRIHKRYCENIKDPKDCILI